MHSLLNMESYFFLTKYVILKCNLTECLKNVQNYQKSRLKINVYLPLIFFIEINKILHIFYKKIKQIKKKDQTSENHKLIIIHKLEMEKNIFF